MVQIPALVQANPDLVLVEFGPNGLWNFYDSDDLNEYIQFRFTINSINMRTKHLGEWTNLIRDIDQQWVAKTDIERINLTKSYSQVAAEEFLKQHVSKYTDLVEFEERAPLPEILIGIDISWSHITGPHILKKCRAMRFEILWMNRCQRR